MKKLGSLAGILVLILISGLAFLPLVSRFSYYNDDWYLMYSAGAYGPGVFQTIFSVDRPGRALVMIPAYLLFGDQPLYYNLSAFLFRVVSGLALWWILNLLWPRQRIATTGMALLFLVYPGFLSQPNAIDYQSHIVGLAAALCSIAFTLKAVTSGSRVNAAIWHILSILLGWLYLLQIEWYIGFEFFRWACVFLHSSHQGGTLAQKAARAVRRAYPALAIPLVFLLWRMFFFVSDRGATDVDLQLGQFKLYPLQTIYHWSVQVIQDLFDVVLSAWAVPLSQLRGAVEPWAFILSLAAAGLLVFFLLRNGAAEVHNPDGSNLTREAVILGLLTAVAGLIPIAMVNREVAFPFYSRYSLVASVGVAIFIVGLLSGIRSRALGYSLFGILVFIALLTHEANSVKFARETSIVRNFWWQVAWRVPQLEQRTTLVGNYPQATIEEDYFIWGPANLIYYPVSSAKKDIQPDLFAAVLNKDTVAKILAKERQEYDNRKNIKTYKNYRNIIVLSQPSLGSCLHVIDGLHPVFSEQEIESIREIGPYSETERILVDESSHTPSAIVFGPEPGHGWCYYYQKADLASQRGDWNQVIQLAEEAASMNLNPSDLIEWMPFLQAYAMSGKTDKLTSVLDQVQSNEYAARQICQQLKSLQTNNAVQSLISSRCVTP